jgi:hypothetical protein
MTKTVIAGALGDCVHVVGVSNFLSLAESVGWRSYFLGPAVSVDAFVQAAQTELETMEADDELLVGVSYRLTRETGKLLLAAFAEQAVELREKGVRFAFAGMPPVAKRAASLGGLFEKVFDGSESGEQVLAYLKGSSPQAAGPSDHVQLAVERVQRRVPYPMLRHRFYMPRLDPALERNQMGSRPTRRQNG